MREYKITDRCNEFDINELAKEGWELMQIYTYTVPQYHGGGEVNIKCIFRRKSFYTYNISKMTETTEPTELTLQELKEANVKLKEELEKAKVEAENRELRKEIARLRGETEFPPYTYTPYVLKPDFSYPKPWDNITLCNNK